MGATSALYSYGFKYENTPGKYDMEGAVNSEGAIKGLEAYKELYKCCTPPGYTDSYMGEDLDAFKSGQVAMMMNWFAFMPGMYKDEKVGGEQVGFFVNPSEKVAASTLGGQGISVVANTDNMEGALAYIKWFAQPDVQKKWWQLGGYACHNAVLNDPGFKDSPALRRRLPARHGRRAGLLAGTCLCIAAPGHAEASARLRRRRQGNRQGGA